MKRIAIIALTFVLAACIMTGCRRNDMQDTVGTDGAGGNTTITTVPDVTILPQPSSHATESTINSNPMDGSSGNEDATPQGRVHGSVR